MIIVNDKSTNNSRDIIYKYSKLDNRIKPLYLESNSGTNNFLNARLKFAQGQSPIG